MNRAMQSALAGNFSTKAAVHGKDEIAASAQALNQLLASLDQVITEANLVLSAVSQADFKQQMKGQYVGDLDRLKQGVNASAHAVSFMIAELEKVMIGLNAGKFDVQMDAKVPLAFRQLVDTSIGRIEAVVKNINTVMREMSEGRFSARIEAEAQGDLDQMKRHINQSLDGLTHAIEQITQRLASLAEGHLSQPDLSRAQFQGQLAELAQAINQAMRKMKDSVAQATRSASIVGEAANHVSQGSSDLSARVQEQASALEETSATMHEMTSAVQTNTDNARRVADLAKQVERDATSGVVVMQQTTTAMQAIRESSHKISDIVSLIDGIAFQTNLLALNAAVEAARAGEMGRGFAVVAGEVRALAQKSAAAAKDIKLLISDSVQRVEVGTDLAEKSGQMLTTITGSIQQVAQMIDDIARASQEQTIGIHQVHRAMSDIDRVTQENAALVEQTSAAAESLHHEAEDLRHNMSVFKI
jgi:methyl-accepting chemotaxis protein